MSFYIPYTRYKDFELADYFANCSNNNVIKSLEKNNPAAEDLITLLSPAAEDFIELMAQKAHTLSLQNFGKSILLYTPLYIANYCENECLYCGFNVKNNIPRKILSLAEIEKEAQAIAKTGLQHILILCGEAPAISSFSYIQQSVRILKKYFSSLSIEIYPLTTNQYKQLIDEGVDGLTLYQEVYNEATYKKLHCSGPKTNYRFRLDAPERALEASMRTVNIGALLGLADVRKEAFSMLLHAQYLQDKYPAAEISISIPRLRPQVADFKAPYAVSDKNLVQIVTVARIFMPRVGITLSTRENARLRDNLIPLGVTKMSAGSVTTVGGHTIVEAYDKTQSQFEIADKRGVEEMKKTLLEKGYQPILKDWMALDIRV